MLGLLIITGFMLLIVAIPLGLVLSLQDQGIVLLFFHNEHDAATLFCSLLMHLMANHIAGADPGLRRGFAERSWVILNPSSVAARINRSAE